ncbi:MAG: hypothetical protein IJQ77_08745, partial [Synergistaceae bacterium]|nr:hypothetical protein [Synergistaceae bacterium]
MGGRGASSGIKRSSKGAGTAASGDMVLGVLQSEIDKLKGTQDHQSPYSIKWQDVKAQYAKVGITVTDQHAQDVYNAVQSFSGSGYTPMRTAMSKFQKGLPLTQQEHVWLDRYKLCEEWCRVAPVFASTKTSVIYRGISKGYS